MKVARLTSALAILKNFRERLIDFTENGVESTRNSQSR
jgi:hypothetical protein